jgi:hypothetical protein
LNLTAEIGLVPASWSCAVESRRWWSALLLLLLLLLLPATTQTSALFPACLPDS